MNRHVLRVLAVCTLGVSGALSVGSQELKSQAPQAFVFDCGKEGTLVSAPLGMPPQTDDVIGWCAISRKDLRNGDDQVITGIGVYPWAEGPNLKVRVFTMIPAPGAANAWHGAPTGVNPRLLVQAKKLAEYTLAFGETKAIEELKAWGVEPMMLRFVERPPMPPARP